MTTVAPAPPRLSAPDAHRLAAKVAADMFQCSLLYGEPGEDAIDQNRLELVTFLVEGLVDRYEFGFVNRSHQRVVSWHYRVTAAGDLLSDRPGGLCSTADLADTALFNLLWPTAAWFELSEREQQALLAASHLERRLVAPPHDGEGTWVDQRTYVAGATALRRSEFGPH